MIKFQCVLYRAVSVWNAVLNVEPLKLRPLERQFNPQYVGKIFLLLPDN